MMNTATLLRPKLNSFTGDWLEIKRASAVHVQVVLQGETKHK